MKKFFTLIAAALMAVSVNATQTEIPLTGWGWGWSSETSNDTDGSLLVSITSDNGAGSTGWSDGADWSGYKSITAVIESCTIPEGGGYAQMQVKYKDADNKDQTLTGSISSNITAQTSVTINFDDPSVLTKVVQLWFQGSKGATFKVSKVYLENDAAEPTQIAIDISGVNGVSKNEDGTYTYTTTAAWGWDNIWYGTFDASGYDFVGVELTEATDVNFQIIVEYADATITKGNIWVGAGSTSGQVDLDATGKSGISQIGFQTSDAGTVKIKSVYWGKKESTGISSIKSESIVDNDAYYNLSGQRVAKPSKGLYIHNGKKVIIK